MYTCLDTAKTEIAHSYRLRYKLEKDGPMLEMTREEMQAAFLRGDKERWGNTWCTGMASFQKLLVMSSCPRNQG